MKSSFTKLESYMESLVEGTFSRLFAGRVHPRDVALQLARALEDSAVSGEPATRYTVHLNPVDARDLLNVHPDLGRTLAGEVLNLAREAGLTLAQRPEVIVLAEPDQPPHTVYILAEAPSTAATATQTMAAVSVAAPATATHAFLILDGERTVVLRDAIVNLGRRRDNQIVIDDARVSRSHAQLRLRFGHYVVYDLGSTGGTFVNGQRIEECVLRAGDVISLGGVPVIYGEDAPVVPDIPSPHSTRPLVPPSTG
jgi:hypothetical protein